MELTNTSETAIQWIISLGVPVLVGLVFMALAAFGFGEFVARAKQAARKMRGQFDQPTDLPVILITALAEAILRRDVDPALVAQITGAAFDAVEKPKEINVGGAVK